MYFKKCNGKVCIETPAEKNINYIKQLWADEDTMNDVGGIIKVDNEKMQHWFRRVVNPGDGTHCYTLIYYDNGYAGEVSFHRYDRKGGTAEFNIKVEHRLRGNGIALNASKMLLDIFFNNYYGTEMKDKIAIGNIGAEILMKKLGFVHSPEQSDGYGKMFIRK